MWQDLCAAAKSGSEVRARHAWQTARRRQRSLAGTRSRISYSASGGRSPELEAAGLSFDEAIAVGMHATKVIMDSKSEHGIVGEGLEEEEVVGLTESAGGG